MTDRDSDSPVKRVTRQGQTVIASVAGDVDMHRSTAFQQSLMELFDLAPSRIVLDLAGVRYIDSSGLASMIKLLSRVRMDGIDLRLCNLTKPVRSMLEITRLDTVFTICASVAEAIES